MACSLAATVSASTPGAAMHFSSSAIDAVGAASDGIALCADVGGRQSPSDARAAPRGASGAEDEWVGWAHS